jgi:hypothetical protein
MKGDALRMKRSCLVALLLTTACIAGGVGQGDGLLSGRWDATVCMDATPMFTAFASTLLVAYEICGWTFSATMGLDDSGWATAVLDAEMLLGPFSGGATVAFLPQSASFSYGQALMRVILSGVQFDTLIRFENEGFGWRAGLSFEAGECDVAALAWFNLSVDDHVQSPGCSWCFSGSVFELTVPVGCAAPLEVSVGISTTEGFEGLVASVENVSLPWISWLLFDVAWTFDDGAQGKTLDLVPHLNFSDDLCFTLYAQLLGTNTLIQGVEFYGVEVAYEWNGIRVSNLTAFDPSDPHELVADPYWEMICIRSVADGCTGGETTFATCTFFEAGSDQLFDWGMTTIDATIGVGPYIELTGGLVVSSSGIDQLCIGFGIIW